MAMPNFRLRALYARVITTLSVIAAMSAGSLRAQDTGPTACVNYIAPDPFGAMTWNPIWDFTNLKQTKVTGLNVGGYFQFNGMLEYLPENYDPGNSSVKHPLIIFFHGGASNGNGTLAHLCRLFKDRGADLATHLSIPGRVERNTSAFSPIYNGQTFDFIVASPQYAVYSRTYAVGQTDEGSNTYPSGDHVEAVINFMIARYGDKLDTNRIYLTGYSSGANMIMEYVGSSLERAQRVAAVMPISLCSQLYHFSNVNRGVNAGYIGQAQLPVWFVNCAIDNPCNITVPQEWYDAITSVPGHFPPRFTILQDSRPDPLYQCSDTLLHDAWSRAYDPAFTQSFVNGNGANDGVNLNMYEWFVAQSNAVLPVRLKSFEARLTGQGVELRWVTTDEKDNAFFTIERAGEDQRFSALTTVPGAGTHQGERTYQYLDASPLQGLGFYRLVQTDMDGKKTYFDIRKVLNRQGGAAALVVSPNPFRSDLTAYVHVDAAQQVELVLMDVSGKPLQAQRSWYAPGTTELSMRTNGLPRGVYILRAQGNGFSVTRRVVKQ